MNSPTNTVNQPPRYIESLDKGKMELLSTLFLVGFTIYQLIYTLLVTGKIPPSGILVAQAIQFLSIMAILIGVFGLIKFRFNNSYLKTIFYLYFFWGIIVLFRGFYPDVDYIKTSLIDAWFGFFIYFAPLVMLFPREISFYKKLANVIIVLGVFYVLLTFFYINELKLSFRDYRLSQALVEYFARNLGLPAGFLLLTYIYHNNKKTLFALGVVMLVLMVSAVRARRSIMFSAMLILVLSYIVFYFSNRGQIVKVIFSVFLVISLVMYVAYVFTMQRSGAFGLLSSRLHEDTRSRVIDNYYNDMQTVDWLIGRGSAGTYFCPGIDEGDRITTHRSVVETGFLQIILKEGLLGLVLFALMALPAIYKGLFKSKNILSKAAALWILIYAINLYPSVWNGFVLFYLLVWISIAICFDPELRQRSDEDLKAEFLPGDY